MNVEIVVECVADNPFDSHNL